jgi:hypothetical protein
MKRKLFILIFILAASILYSQSSSSPEEQTSLSSDNYYYNTGLPKLSFVKPFKRFKPWIPVKSWKRWNELRGTGLEIVTPRLKLKRRFLKPLKRVSFVPVIIVPLISERVVSVTSAGSNTVHYNILQDESANYGVSLSGKYNFVLVFSGETVPRDDFNVYAIIYINNKRIGATDKGLITQRKVFKYKLDTNRHLLKIRVVIQDKYQKRWRSLLNTMQPKEKYFPVKKGFITLVKMTYLPKNRYNKYQFTGRFVARSSLSSTRNY